MCTSQVVNHMLSYPIFVVTNLLRVKPVKEIVAGIASLKQYFIPPVINIYKQKPMLIGRT